LDRAFGNSLLKILLPNTMVNHLSCLSSDYCPVMLNLFLVDVIRAKKFRFESMWLGHLDFYNVVSETWNRFPYS
ncbi:hypothetical protein CFOL_v3_30019, partial [Cephalotus follicularis]